MASRTTDAVAVVAWMSVQPTSAKRTVWQEAESPAKAALVERPAASSNPAAKVLISDICSSPILYPANLEGRRTNFPSQVSSWKQTSFCRAFKEFGDAASAFRWPAGDTTPSCGAAAMRSPSPAGVVRRPETAYLTRGCGLGQPWAGPTERRFVA
jgi:hypothetical protein